MQMDSDTLTTIQEYRVHADPIIGSDHASGAANLEDAIHEERATLVDETPGGERTPVAAWGELAILCSTASLTHAAFTNEAFVRLFQFVLRETLAAMTTSDQGADAILPSTFPDLPPTDQTRERARALREALKRDRDQWFANTVDDLEIDTDGVPPAYWLRGATETTASEQLATWYVAGDVSDRLINSLPSLPGQTPSTPGEGETTAGEASEEATSDRAADQSSLTMF